jgi:hypothetical protein
MLLHRFESNAIRLFSYHVIRTVPVFFVSLFENPTAIIQVDTILCQAIQWMAGRRLSQKIDFRFCNFIKGKELGRTTKSSPDFKLQSGMFLLFPSILLTFFLTWLQHYRYSMLLKQI